MNISQHLYRQMLQKIVKNIRKFLCIFIRRAFQNPWLTPDIDKFYN